MTIRMTGRAGCAGCLTALLLVGCLAQPGSAVSGFGPGDQPVMTTAPADGVYGLFIGHDADPILRLSLKQSDPLGFDHRLGGTVGELQISYLVAVGGTAVLPLQNGQHYVWRLL